MVKLRTVLLACAIVMVPAWLGAMSLRSPAAAILPAASPAATGAMTRAAEAFLSGLTPDQKAQAEFTFADSERLNWHFIPRERRGLSLGEMTERQREAARTLLRTGISQPGMQKVDAIIELENVLRDLGGNPQVRNPELYFVSVFGTPSANGPWGWRFEGHHLSLNFTVVDGQPVATAPAFFGANPARVPSGDHVGMRALAAEEDLARDLVTALTPAQRSTAIVLDDAPNDIFTSNTLDIDPLTPVGIAVGDLDANQRRMLVRLIDEYLDRMAPELASERRSRLQTSDLDRVTFAWAGSVEEGEAHYYRVQGPTFLIEYDNVQNNANHIHSVWRDFDGDFGRDLIGEHYQNALAGHGH